MSIDPAFREVCKKAVEKWGVDAQLLQLQEEAAELIAAISHFRRGRAGSREEVLEELADMSIMMEQTHVIFSDDDIINVRMFKVERLCDRLDIEYSRG